MNRDDIIRMAREQGLPETLSEGVFIVNSDDLGRMLAAEREECAKIVDRWHDGPSSEPEMAEIAAEIRARGQG